MKTDIPEYCGFDCPVADFAPADTAGICRTMSAVWCGKLKELVNKNSPCQWRKRGRPITRPAAATSGKPGASARPGRSKQHGEGNAPVRRSRRRA